VSVEGGAWSGTGGKVAGVGCDYSSVTIQTSQRCCCFATSSYFMFPQVKEIYCYALKWMFIYVVGNVNYEETVLSLAF
jgi:hypothetical protein